LARPMDEKAYGTYLESRRADDLLPPALPGSGESTAEDAAIFSIKPL
jgi:hypothetical protein